LIRIETREDRMQSRVLTVGLIVALAVTARAEGVEPAADPEDGSGWACTPDTLLSGKDCAFESESKVQTGPEAARQSADNARSAGAFGPKACAAAATVATEARPDKDLLAVCERDFAEAAAHCDVGPEPLLDGKGRFAASARGCYQGLSRVLQRVALMASVTVKCCRCLAKTGCARSAEQCNRDLSRDLEGGAPSAAAGACMHAKCPDACLFQAPRREDPEKDEPREEPPTPRVRKI
jgi:hypothetical protein